MSAARATALGVTPLARIIGWASAGVDPRIMGIGPVPAMRKLFERTGLSLADFDLFELNEAFAPQVLAVLRDEPIPADKLNVNGGAIALGHPIGCTGTRIVVTLLYEMQRRRRARGLATLCVSGGMGMAMAVELTHRLDRVQQGPQGSAGASACGPSRGAGVRFRSVDGSRLGSFASATSWR